MLAQGIANRWAVPYRRSVQQALDLVGIVENSLQSSMHTKPLLPSELVSHREHQLLERECCGAVSLAGQARACLLQVVNTSSSGSTRCTTRRPSRPTSSVDRRRRGPTCSSSCSASSSQSRATTSYAPRSSWVSRSGRTLGGVLDGRLFCRLPGGQWASAVQRCPGHPHHSAVRSAARVPRQPHRSFPHLHRGSSCGPLAAFVELSLLTDAASRDFFYLRSNSK